jgi:K+-transporting ATPase KdpF subunit
VVIVRFVGEPEVMPCCLSWRCCACSSRSSLFAEGWSISARASSTRETGADPAMALYVLAILLVLLIVYLFYAVIHPERF